LADRIPLTSGTKIAHMGCGEGEFSALACARGIHADEFDSSEAMIAKVWENALNAQFHRFYIIEIPDSLHGNNDGI